MPLAVLLAITVGAARLYAESAPPPPLCSSPQVTACSGKSTGDVCTIGAPDAATSGTCYSTLCQVQQGGLSQLMPVCELTVGTGVGDGGDERASEDVVGQPEAGVMDATSADANVEMPDGAQGTAHDANGPLGVDDAAATTSSPASGNGGGGCNSAGLRGAGPAGSFFGILVAISAIVARRRRARSEA